MSTPLADGLWEAAGDGGVRLVGARCGACATLYFPRVATCRNPACDDGVPERALLPERGRIVSHTVQHYRPPPPFRMDDWAPYPIALVAFDGGVEVMGMLTGFDADAVPAGARVRTVVRTLFTDAERGPVDTWMFAP